VGWGARVGAVLRTADALVDGLEWRDHRRAAKKRARTIENARDRRRGSDKLSGVDQADPVDPDLRGSGCGAGDRFLKPMLRLRCGVHRHHFNTCSAISTA